MRLLLADSRNKRRFHYHITAGLRAITLFGRILCLENTSGLCWFSGIRKYNNCAHRTISLFDGRRSYCHRACFFRLCLF